MTNEIVFVGVFSSRVIYFILNSGAACHIYWMWDKSRKCIGLDQRCGRPLIIFGLCYFTEFFSRCAKVSKKLKGMEELRHHPGKEKEN
jgi:hypothetical protein